MKTSEKISNLMPAFFEASKKLENPTAIADNPFYKSKYTPLDYLIKHIKKAINQHGLCVVQSPELQENEIIITTRLYHVTGEWLETQTGVPAGKDAQKIGAAITYARRYALSALFNIASDMDNDANETIEKPKSKPVDKTVDKPVDKLSQMPADVRQLFLDKGYKTKTQVQSACETCNWNWDLLRKHLKQFEDVTNG